ncbi:LysR family transcriptional regulator [Dyella monticola]|uniref:LysR family transcriptional regulator n=1 Tax=Dyella monticola TaxID=1927958 RepID=A0A370X513_9GAMM|nr:LysR family transcriptional regulator [Dyella monticola]RDS83523.1 LysR family transcriptional regulator [Dyella monticola]
MDRLETLQLFTRIVETGSFSRAADVLDMPRPTATYAIQQLEARLGVRLLERTTRQVRPTLDGQAFYERCVHILSDLEDAESSLKNIASNPRGTLRVDMATTHATHIVLPRIDDFRSRYPNIDLVISSGDRLVDLVREGVDCVIRAGTPRDSTLVARQLASMPQVICASPEYLAFFGVPHDPSELSNHQVVKFFSSGTGIDDTLELIVDGKLNRFALGGWMAVNDAENYVVSALRGCGMIQLPRFHVEDALRTGRLVEILGEWRSPDLPLSALYPYRRQLSRRVRVFIDWLGDVYKDTFGELA